MSRNTSNIERIFTKCCTNFPVYLLRGLVKGKFCSMYAKYFNYMQKQIIHCRLLATSLSIQCCRAHKFQGISCELTEIFVTHNTRIHIKHNWQYKHQHFNNFPNCYANILPGSAFNPQYWQKKSTSRNSVQLFTVGQHFQLLKNVCSCKNSYRDYSSRKIQLNHTKNIIKSNLVSIRFENIINEKNFFGGNHWHPPWIPPDAYDLNAKIFENMQRP